MNWYFGNVQLFRLARHERFLIFPLAGTRE